MKSSIKSLTKQTLVYGVGTIMARLVTFMLLPLYTNVMPAADYGLVALVFAFLGFMNHVYNYGLDSSVMRYYGSAETDTERREVYSSAIWMTLGSSFILSLLVYGLSHPLSRLLLSDPAYDDLLRYSAVILFFDCICRVPFALLRMEERPMLFMAIRLFNVIVTLALNIWFVAVLRMGVDGIFKSTVITSAVTAVLLYAFTAWKIRPTLRWSTARELLIFGLPFVPTGLATAAMEMLNRYLVEHYLDLTAVGVFSAGFKLGIFMLLIVTAFYYAWQPFFLKAGKQESSRPLFARILTYFVLVTLGFWLLLTLLMHEIVYLRIAGFALIGRAEYRACEPIVPLILLGYVFFGINQVFLPGIYFEKKTRWLATLTILAAGVNIGANMALIPVWGIVGSALASLIGYLFLAGSTLIVSQRLFRVPYEYGRIALLFGITLAVGLPVYFWTIPLGWRLIMIAIFPLLLRGLGFFRPEEIATLRVRWRGIISR